MHAPDIRGSVAQRNPFEIGLDRTRANYVPLSPASFLSSAAASFGSKIAVIDGERRCTYGELHDRCRRLASALSRRGIGRLDTVAILVPNIVEMIEAHYAVPMLGAVLNPLNTRLDAATIAFSLDHGCAKAVLVDGEYAPLMAEALRHVRVRPLVVDITAPDASRPCICEIDYEVLLSEGDCNDAWRGPEDEWQSLCLLYTSGTTSDPKGVVNSHRGAYLQALGNAVTFGLNADSVYLWTLPMFHCNGWSYPWAVGASSL